jgi:DNA polymerase sigma
MYERRTLTPYTFASRTAPEGKRSLLHEELLDFEWRCTQTPASMKLAQLSMRAVELAWDRCNTGSRIKLVPFGSQPCAVALPGGDLDVYVIQVRYC